MGAALISTLPRGCFTPEDLRAQALEGTPDGGVVSVPDGGPPIVLDDRCPPIDLVGPFIWLPGCCTPSGMCGGSTHLMRDHALPVDVPLMCATHAELRSAIGFYGMYVPVPPDPQLSCEAVGIPAP